MTSIIFKKLFEINILHDYFLATRNTSFFSPSLSDNDRGNMLGQKYNFDLNKVIKVQPTDACKELMKNHKLRLINTRFGFFIAQKVKAELQDSGALLYKPFVPFLAVDGLSFYLKVFDNYFQNYTGVPFRTSIPSLYYFSNADEESNKVFPALSKPVPVFQSGNPYEMGELAMLSGQLSEAIVLTEDNNPGNWQSVEGSGYVSQADSLLLPRKFLFPLNTANLPSSITTKLFKPGEKDVVKHLDTQVDGNPVVFLNFCNNPVDNCVEEGWYDLEVKDQSNKILFKKKVLLNDQLYNKNSFGLIEIFQSSDSEFGLLDSDGFLLHRINADQTKTSHPIFEIRLRSRNTYWRYKSEKAFPQSDIDATRTILNIVPNSGNTMLVADRPESLIEGVNKPLDAIDLPNPTPATLKYGTDGKIYSDIYISSINKFLN